MVATAPIKNTPGNDAITIHLVVIRSPLANVGSIENVTLSMQPGASNASSPSVSGTPGVRSR
jgi:hypothetical protein